MIITVITICKARMPKNKKDDAAPFARAQPYYCLKQSHRSHVLFMNDHNHCFKCHWYKQNVLLDRSSFFMQWTQYCCDPLIKPVGCKWAVVFFGLAKLAKNANVYENCMIGLVHLDSYTQIFMVG